MPSRCRGGTNVAAKSDPTSGSICRNQIMRLDYLADAAAAFRNVLGNGRKDPVVCPGIASSAARGHRADHVLEPISRQEVEAVEGGRQTEAGVPRGLHSVGNSLGELGLNVPNKTARAEAWAVDQSEKRT